LERAWARLYAKLLLRLTPRPHLSYLLDAEPESAYGRKPEYPIEFLRQYRNSYLELAKLNGMVVVPPLPLDEASRQVAVSLETLGIALQRIPAETAVPA